MTEYGYARVSTQEQNLARQTKALLELKIDEKNIFTEKISGAKRDRPVLNELLQIIQEGDIIHVTDLTRITRSSKDLFELVDIISGKGANLKSIKDTWLDISKDSTYGKFLLQVMGAVNELERNLIRERVREGVDIAKAQGKYKGRPKKYTERNPKLMHALELYKDGKMTVKNICEVTGVSRSSLYEVIKEWDITRGGES